MPQTVLNAPAVVRALQGAFARETPRHELLQLAARKLREAGPPYTGVYLYMLHGDELKLEAFEGRPTEHTTIPVGRGICGKAVAERRDLNVGDVSQAEGYLACSVETKSELVVLIRFRDTIFGQIDVDSDQPDPFTEAEVAAVREVADALAVLL
ncbi:MAG: GAF domain-containing protein [Gemmatimonadales bacterium]|jgi:GAF domain-containing protein